MEQSAIQRAEVNQDDLGRPLRNEPSRKPATAGSRGADRHDGDRRGAARVKQRALTRDESQQFEADSDLRHVLPIDPRPLALCLALAYGLAAIVAQRVPTEVGFWVAIAASVMLFAVGSWLARLERQESAGTSIRYAILLLGVVVPMASAGYVLGAWVGHGLAWQWAVASIVCINAISAAILGLRVASLFAGKLAIWAAFATIDPSLSTFAAISAATVALVLVGRLEWKATERRQIVRDARERLATRAEDILHSFEETGQGWFWETDRRGLISYISHSAASVLDKSQEDLLGRPLSEIVETGSAAKPAERTLAFHLSSRSAFHEIELKAAGADPERWWALTGRPVYDSFNNFCGFRGHGTDLTEQRRSEQQASRLAHFDSLTGLANRFQMSQTLERILAAPRERDRACAVLMLDLDRFKQVNDTLGHPAGDALLKQVALRLERAVDGRGRCGRLGGDEFKVILPANEDRARLVDLAREIIASLSQPYSLDGQSVVIGVSIGIAIAPDDGSASDELIRNVDLALYAAKDAGRGTYRFYADDLHSAAEERAVLEKDLRDAIARDELELYYQPVVYTATEKLAGFEALLRWHHPEKGWQSPARFIPIAEDAGLIDKIGAWALQTACADLAKWPDHVRCAVNVSPLQFSNPELPTVIANALAASKVEPSRLELEITESVFLNDTPGTDAMFTALKRLGVRLALDDFGTGYSSLGYLKKAPFDKIKIDQSFVRGATEKGSRNGAIIASITGLAEALEMDTTAEGVELLDELALIRKLGCSHVQGNIYHRALSPEDAAALVAADEALSPEGYKSARAPRQVLLRRITVFVEGREPSSATIRSISSGGAMIEGVWDLEAGAPLSVQFSKARTVSASVRWARDNQIGVEFDEPLKQAEDGTFRVLRDLN